MQELRKSNKELLERAEDTKREHTHMLEDQLKNQTRELDAALREIEQLKLTKDKLNNENLSLMNFSQQSKEKSR